MLEHVKTYAEVRAEEEAARQALQTEEDAQKQSEKEQAEEDAARQEAEAREAERLAVAEREKSQSRMVLAFSLIGAAVLAAILFLFILPKRPRR